MEVRSLKTELNYKILTLQSFECEVARQNFQEVGKTVRLVFSNSEEEIPFIYYLDNSGNSFGHTYFRMVHKLLEPLYGVDYEWEELVDRQFLLGVETKVSQKGHPYENIVTILPVTWLKQQLGGMENA